MVLTLTANPAIDLNFAADRLAFDDRAYMQECFEAPGGRGINASTVLDSLGVETFAIAPCGGESGRRFRQLLANHGFETALVPIQNEIRTNYAITDRQGLTVKLDQKGPTLDAAETSALEKAVLDHLTGASWLLLCGSLPPGVPTGFYRRLIEEARRRGVNTLLDAGGAPVLDGLEAHPSVVAPNQVEAEELLDRALVMRSHFFEAVEQIQTMGSESVILSLGSRGAVARHRDQVAEILPPRIDSVCPIGAGDALNAALVWAILNGSDFFDAVRWGVAAGTASARLPGLDFAPLEQIREIYAEVEVRVAG